MFIIFFNLSYINCYSIFEKKAFNIYNFNEMEQLMKAEQFLKKSISRQVEQYIFKAQTVATEYLHQKQQAGKKSIKNITILKELKRQHKILHEIKLKGIQISQCSRKEINELILHYSSIIEQYEFQRQTLNEESFQKENLNIDLKNEEESFESSHLFRYEQQPITKISQFQKDPSFHVRSSSILIKQKIFALKLCEFVGIILLLVSILLIILK